MQKYEKLEKIGEGKSRLVVAFLSSLRNVALTVSVIHIDSNNYKYQSAIIEDWIRK